MKKSPRKVTQAEVITACEYVLSLPRPMGKRNLGTVIPLKGPHAVPATYCRHVPGHVIGWLKDGLYSETQYLGVKGRTVILFEAVALQMALYYLRVDCRKHANVDDPISNRVGRLKPYFSNGEAFLAVIDGDVDIYSDDLARDLNIFADTTDEARAKQLRQTAEAYATTYPDPIHFLPIRGNRCESN
jgi:hypothetical protein